MKIATVSPYDFAIPGGVNANALAMSRWLRSEGHEVQVIGPSSSRNGLTPADVTVVGRPRRINAGGTVASIALSPGTDRRVRSLLADGQFDIVHLHEPLMPLLPLQFLRHSKALNVGTFHAAEGLGRRLHRFSAPLLRPWARRLHARTAVSVTARETAASHLRGAWEIIPCCVDVEHFARPAPPPEACADGRPTLLFVGRIEPRKGLDVLLRAFTQLQRQRPDWRLVVVGPQGPLGERVAKRWASDDIIFTGTVPYADLPRYYQAADIFCAPATGGEAFGIVLVEAMAAGAPVVASDIPGYRNVIRSADEAVLTPPNDAPALAAALKALIDDAPRRRALSERGRQRAADFHLATVGRQLLDLYDRHLSRVSGRAGSTDTLGR